MRTSRRGLLLAIGVALARAFGPRVRNHLERIDRLTALFRRRWACPVIAELHRSDGAKFVTLVNRLGSNPAAMRTTLDDLLELGWIRRNPGYGHPMRPEYLLTAHGERIAARREG